MTDKFGYVQCDRHGYVEATETGACLSCIRFDKKTQQIKNDGVRRTNTILCRRLDFTLRKLKRGIKYKQNIRYLTEDGAGNTKVFQVVTVSVDGTEDRQYRNKSYFKNIPVYKKLHELHRRGLIYWNYGDEDKQLNKTRSSPSLVVAPAAIVADIFRNTLFKVVEIAINSKKVIHFEGRSLTSYVKQFGSIFA